MAPSVIGLIIVPLLDQTVKLLVGRRLGRGSIPLGPLGAIRLAQAPIWIMRGPGRCTLGVTWALWLLGAGALALVAVQVPSLAPFCGLVLGGSLSHAVEISLRGSICDYVCLRFWPAFDLADVALAIGAVEIVVELVAALPRPWP